MIHLDMTDAKYRAAWGLNASLLKDVARKPLAKVRHDLAHPRTSTAFDVGTAAHALILEGDESRFVVVEAEDWRTKAAQQARDAAHAAGLTPLLSKEHAAVTAMARAVREHPDAGPLFVGHEPEASIFADLYGVEAKGRIDAWHADAGVVVDLKTTGTSADPADLPRTVEALGYAQQAAHYIDLVTAETGFEPRFLFVHVEKEAPHLVSVVELDEEWIEDGRRLNAAAAAKWLAAVEADDFPGYRGITTISRPAWAKKKENEQ